MAAEATSHPRFVDSLNVLFYFATWLGVMPYSIPAYRRQRVLQTSIFGNVFVCIMVVQSVVQYHFASLTFSMGDKKESGTLTVIIGYVIVYMEPLMLTFDVIGFVVHQRLLIRLIDQMQHVDDQLARQHVHVDYAGIRRMTVWLLSIVTVVELSIVTYNFLLYQDLAFESVWWFITCVPLFLSSMSKIWFITLMTNVKLKFEAINTHMQETVKFYVALREKQQPQTLPKTQQVAHLRDDNDGSQHEPNIGFLQQEIFGRRPAAFRQKRASIGDIFTVVAPVRKHRGIIQVQPVHPESLGEQPPDLAASLGLVAADKQLLNRRLTALCQLHDEICDIGKGINRVFSFQMLILMAYGFMSLTAKLYFVYCGLTQQNIPILFRSAESLPVSVLFIVYTGAKCVYVIYISWQTKLTAQKTGVMLHKVANVVDENDCYVVVNHLSLKLLNHHLTFTACGFFDLDMTTLYAITGAITSYLIILIQFNLAAQRNRKPQAGVNGTTLAEFGNGTGLVGLSNATVNDRNALLNLS